MKLNDLKKPAIYGTIFVGMIILLELYLFYFCTNDFGCLALAFLPAFPSLIIGVSSGTWIGMFVNLIFYFLIGALVGYLVQKFKK